MAIVSAPAPAWATKLPVVALVAADLEPRGRCRYALRLNANLANAGFQPLVVCRQILDEEDRRLLPRAIERPELRIPIWGWWIEGDLIDELKSKRVEIVHALCPSAAAFGRRLADALETPLVVSVHDFLTPRDRFRFAPKHGGRVITSSGPVKADLLLRTQLDGELVKVVTPGVEIPCGVPEEDARPHIRVVGSAGPLEAAQGQEYFIRAAELISRQVPNLEFVVAGAGPDEHRLRRLVDKLNLAPHFTFAPDLQDYDMALGAMDVFCQSSLHQGAATVLFEALALGKPCVATRIAGTTSVLKHGEHAWLVPSANVAALADGILELLNDPERAKKLGRNGQKLATEQLNVETMVQHTAAVYRKLLQKKMGDIRRT